MFGSYCLFKSVFAVGKTLYVCGSGARSPCYGLAVDNAVLCTLAKFKLDIIIVAENDFFVLAVNTCKFKLCALNLFAVDIGLAYLDISCKVVLHSNSLIFRNVCLCNKLAVFYLKLDVCCHSIALRSHFFVKQISTIGERKYLGSRCARKPLQLC